jgi:Domain of unknown function (DUF5668)
VTVRRGLFWPILLIVIGAVFLAGNFGLVPPLSVLGLVSLWPIILIVVGIDIAIGPRSPLAALAIDMVVLAAGVALVMTQPVYPGFISFGGGTGGPAESQVSVPRGTAASLTLHVNGGAGSFNVSGGAAELVEVTSDQPDLNARITGTDHVDVRIDQSNRGVRFGSAAAVHVAAKIASDVPTSLDLNAGAGEFTMDLTSVKLTDARLNVGAASLRIVLPRVTGDVPITVSAGASSIVIEVPEGVEARINTGGALLSVHSENPRIGGTETSGYANAKDRVTVRVTAGASSIVIR